MSHILNRIATNQEHGSGDNLYYQAEQTGQEVSQTLSFRDGSTQWATAMADAYDSTRDVTYHEDVPLAEFFARPVKVATYTWGTADVSPFFQSFNPWSLFLANPRVANRISNYQNFSANLHVKFVMNGNSFLYGRLMADYFPLRSYDIISDTAGGAANLVNLTQASQRLHLYMDPCESQAGEMTLPFLWFYDKCSLVSGDFSTLGTMYLRQLQSLKHANGATANINITVFVWATNVKLSIPTVADISGITPQAGTMDEYGTGPVSGVASAVGAAAGALSRIPYIGKYARATEMMASGMSKIATLFGFSRPAIIADYTDMHPAWVGRIANCSGGDTVAKLSVDPKQELTIDPSVMGLSGVDELSITYLAGKESYLTQFPWTVARVANDALFSMRVGPVCTIQSALYYFPAVTYATLPFKYWRGTMVYRFQIVASGFHKGRLLVVWDPYAQTGGPETNVQYSKIVDLSDERDFTFEVGWGSQQAWLETPQIAAMQAYQTSGAITTANNGNFNGVVTVYVLNELTTPSSIANNDISINVFVAGCKDYKVTVPTPDIIGVMGDRNSITPQSGAFDEVVVENKNAPRNEDAKETIAMCEPLTDNTDAVYMGEAVVSMRTLLKRYCYQTSLYGVTTATPTVQQLYLTDYPANRGYSLYGMVLRTANNYNPTNTTIMNYLGYAFIGYRGGVRRKVIVNSSDIGGTNSSVVCRTAATRSVAAIAARAVTDTITSQDAFAVRRLNSQWPNTTSGGHLTVTRHQPNLEYEVPFYRNYRFGSTRNTGGRFTFSADDYGHIICTQTPANATTSYDIYVAGSEDSQFLCFQGCPPMAFYFV